MLLIILTEKVKGDPITLQNGFMVDRYSVTSKVKLISSLGMTPWLLSAVKKVFFCNSILPWLK